MGPSSLVEQIDSSPLLSESRLADLTSRLVAVPSANGIHPELALARVIGKELESSGFEPTLVGSEGRPSLAAAGRGEPQVLLNGHLDTVPVEDADDWRFDPYAGTVAGGAVHGRGACDMKGGLAVEIAVAQWLAAQGLADGLVLHFAMGEERGEPGTEALLEAGFDAPLGVVLEPTDLRLGVAQRGLMTIRITVEGRAGHASRPDLATNPIERLGPLLGVIEDLDATPAFSHPLLGAPAWTTTMIRAGVIPSMIPGRCEVLVDRRMIPGETPDSVLETLGKALADAGANDGLTLAVASEEGVYEPAETPADGVTASLMSRALELCGEEADIFGTPYSSDVRHLINSAGVDSITYGPGRLQEMHARDEFVFVADLVRAARSVAVFAHLALTDETREEAPWEQFTG